MKSPFAVLFGLVVLCSSVIADEKNEFYVEPVGSGGHLELWSYTGVIIEKLWHESSASDIVLRLKWTGNRTEEELKVEMVMIAWTVSLKPGRTIVTATKVNECIQFSLTIEGEESPYSVSEPYPIELWDITEVTPDNKTTSLTAEAAPHP